MTLEKYVTGTGQTILVHPKEKCSSDNCVIHNPSRHSMSSFPTHWRDDIGLMERVCPHGVGHPDPDDIAFTMALGGPLARLDKSIHGCDGCCKEDT